MDCVGTGESAFSRAFVRFVGIVRRLRSPGGCPWDMKQTLSSLKPCLMEEAYELLEKMDSADAEGHKEELGDLLLQIVFQSLIREDEGKFALAEVIENVSAKLVRRHPHVFSDKAVDGVDDVLRNWEKIKKEERKESSQSRSALAGVPKCLPALLKAQRVQSKALRCGFSAHGDGVSPGDLREALESLFSAQGDAERRKGVGKLLFALAAYASQRGVDPETALEERTEAFARDFMEFEKNSAIDQRGQTP